MLQKISCACGSSTRSRRHRCLQRCVPRTSLAFVNPARSTIHRHDAPAVAPIAAMPGIDRITLPAVRQQAVHRLVYQGAEPEGREATVRGPARRFIGVPAGAQRRLDLICPPTDRAAALKTGDRTDLPGSIPPAPPGLPDEQQDQDKNGLRKPMISVTWKTAPMPGGQPHRQVPRRPPAPSTATKRIEERIADRQVQPRAPCC